MNSCMACIAIVASMAVGGCIENSEQRFLTVGGTHVIEGEEPCTLLGMRPDGIVKDLGWSGTLALETMAEGVAEVACGNRRIALQMNTPTRLDIAMADGLDPLSVVVGQRFTVRARLHDRQSRELEVGKLTLLDWTASGTLEPAVDHSAGEFGYCESCYGMYPFRAVSPGEGIIEVGLGGLRERLRVLVAPSP